MNVISKSKLPFLKIKDYYMLVDSGSTINLISQKYVYENKEKFTIFKEKFEFQTATGRQKGNEYVILSIEKIESKFYLCDFHQQFNLLMSLPLMVKLKVKLDFEENTITILNKKHKLQYFYNKKNVKNNVNNVEKIKIRA